MAWGMGESVVRGEIYNCIPGINELLADGDEARGAETPEAVLPEPSQAVQAPALRVDLVDGKRPASTGATGGQLLVADDSGKQDTQGPCRECD